MIPRPPRSKRPDTLLPSPTLFRSAAFEERGADREVVLRRAHHLVERAARMADLQPEIPQRIELRLDHLLGPARLLERGEEADADIAEIGRASCRERVCQYRVDLGGRRILKKKRVRQT